MSSYKKLYSDRRWHDAPGVTIIGEPEPSSEEEREASRKRLLALIQKNKPKGTHIVPK